MGNLFKFYGTCFLLLITNTFSYAVNIEGVWDTNWNAMTLWQNNSSIQGEYIYNNGVITGVLNGNLFYGWWREHNNSIGCGPNGAWSGPAVFKFSDDAKSFTGSWGYCSTLQSELDPDDYGWNGTKRTETGITKTECEAVERYWCNDSCQINSCGGEITQSSCEKTGRYWCDGNCQINSCENPITKSDCDILGMQLCNGQCNSSCSSTSPPDTQLTVVEDKGSAIVATPVGIDTTHSSVPTANAIVTGSNDQISLVDEDDSRVTINPNTLVTQHPKQVVDTQEIKTTTLLRGSLELKIPTTGREYILATPIANFVVGATSSTKRAESLSVDFKVDYSQQEFYGNVKITVTTGSVEMIDRKGEKLTLVPGKEHEFSGIVRRSSWVLPIDGDFIYGGKENSLCWLAYPGAAGYILEYNFPSPFFSEENPASPEYINKSIYFYPSQYTIWEDLIILPLEIPDLPGEVVEARIFPINSEGKVISDSVSSDKGTYTFK